MLPLFSVDIVGIVAVLQPDQEVLLSPLSTTRRAWGGKKEQSAKIPNHWKDVEEIFVQNLQFKEEQYERPGL